MKNNRSISELLTDYEKTLNPDDNVTVSVGNKSIMFNKSNLSEKEILKYESSLSNFLSSEEGKRLIPDNKQ